MVFRMAIDDLIFRITVTLGTLAWFILTIVISGKMSEIKLLIAQVDRDLKVHISDYKARHDALETHMKFTDSRIDRLEHSAAQGFKDSRCSYLNDKIK